MDTAVPMLGRGLYYGSLGIWMGSILMLSLGSKVAFRLLSDRQMAGNLVGGWLAVYHRLGLVCALGASAAALYRILVWESQLWQGPWNAPKQIALARTLLLALMVLSHLYAGCILHPEIHRLREAGMTEAFRALHVRSVVLLMANLLFGIAVIFLS